MPLILPTLKDIKKLARQTRIKRGRPIKSPPKSEAELRHKLSEMWNKILFPATERIKQLIKDNASAAIIAENIEEMLRTANGEYARFAPHIAAQWKMSLDRETRRATNASLKAALGIDVQYILDEPIIVGTVKGELRSFITQAAAEEADAKNIGQQTVEDAMSVGALQCAGLIKTIPAEHLGRVAKAVADNFAGRQTEPLLKTIQKLGGITEKRARMIARDQTASMTANVNRIRQQSIGINEYIWRGARDNREVGNPNGVSPVGSKGHHDHWMMEGMHCLYSDNTVWSKDGKVWEKRPAKAPQVGPGVEILCRCNASPVIDPVKIAEMAREG